VISLLSFQPHRTTVKVSIPCQGSLKKKASSRDHTALVEAKKGRGLVGLDQRNEHPPQDDPQQDQKDEETSTTCSEDLGSK
jgi:hypothetical protein